MERGNERTRARGAIDWARSLKLTDDQLRRMLGVSEPYFRRVLAEAYPDNRPSNESSARFLNPKILDALSGIREVVESMPLAREETVDVYLNRVLNEIKTLDEGDIHTLVFVPSPLERDHHVVRQEVLEAAHRGATFNYYYPSRRAVKKFFKSLASDEEGGGVASPQARIDQDPRWQSMDEPEQSEVRKQVMQIEILLNWMRDIDGHMGRLRRDFRNLALSKDEDCGGSGYHNALLKRVRFWPLRWIPISFNEKVVWITRAGQKHPEIRKEMFTIDEREPQQSAHASGRLWMRVKYPITEDLLRAMLKMAREQYEPEKYEVDQGVADDA